MQFERHLIDINISMKEVHSDICRQQHSEKISCYPMEQLLLDIDKHDSHDHFDLFQLN